MTTLKQTILIVSIAIFTVIPLAADQPAAKVSEAKSETPVTKKPAEPKLDLYGYIKLDGSWDGCVIEAGNFARWVASPSIIDSHEHFNMTARQTRLGMRINRERDGEMIVKGRIEIDFYGGGAENKNQPMLRHGYAEIDWPEKGLNLKAGQTSDLISPLVPATINYPVAWWAGNIGYRRPQLRLTKTVETGEGAAVVMAAALSRSIGDDFARLEPGDSGADSGVPTVQVALSRRFTMSGKPAAIGLSGHWGEEEIHERLETPVVEFNSWSLGLDFSLPLSQSFTLKGEVWTGQDLDDYLGGIGQGINLASGEAVEAQGGWLAIEGRPSAKTFVGLGASVDDPQDEDLAAGARARNASLWGTFLYDIRSYLKTGVEVSHWATDYIELEDNAAYRVQGTLIYSF